MRPARPDDANEMARVHVESWRETYRGTMPDAVLDDPDAVAGREQFWRAALTDPRYSANRSAVAELDGELVGVAMTGAPSAPADGYDRQLYVLYLLKRAHGSGAAARMLNTVLDLAESAVLWVADPNPRAQAFYRREGFVADGGEGAAYGIREIRMVRIPRR